MGVQRTTSEQQKFSVLAILNEDLVCLHAPDGCFMSFVPTTTFSPCILLTPESFSVMQSEEGSTSKRSNWREPKMDRVYFIIFDCGTSVSHTHSTIYHPSRKFSTENPDDGVSGRAPWG
jgi:hypothetical protein